MSYLKCLQCSVSLDPLRKEQCTLPVNAVVGDIEDTDACVALDHVA